MRDEQACMRCGQMMEPSDVRSKGRKKIVTYLCPNCNSIIDMHEYDDEIEDGPECDFE